VIKHLYYNDLHLDYLNNDRVRYRIQLVEQVRASLINNRPFGTIDSKSVSFTDMGFLTADKKKKGDLRLYEELMRKKKIFFVILFYQINS
jgi:hypothetical protein